MTGDREPVEPRDQTPAESEIPSPPQEPGPPCPPCPEPQIRFPTQFARLFFGVITLLVLYYTYEIIKPYLVDIFLALVIFFTAKPLFEALTRLFFGKRSLASIVTCLILALLIIIPLVTLVSIVASQALEFSSQISLGLQSGKLGQWVNTNVDLLKAYLIHLNLPLPAKEIKLEGLIQSVLSNASRFIYTNAI